MFAIMSIYHLEGVALFEIHLFCMEMPQTRPVMQMSASAAEFTISVSTNTDNLTALNSFECTILLVSKFTTCLETQR